MPWRKVSVEDARLEFIARKREGHSMTELCREFGISRKTGYKIVARYEECGAAALFDRPRTPGRVANRLAPAIEQMIVDLKRAKPHWGARKLRELLARRMEGAAGPLPARSTLHAVLDRHGLVEHAQQRRARVTGTALSDGAQPNDLWCVDFKGEFLLGDKRYCYPLTVTDHSSRYLLLCEALTSTREDPAIAAFARLFQERGLPRAIRSDNGVPFATPNGLYNLSRLSVAWLRLGIAIERITPGRPQQNGRHERMHLTLKKETTRPAGANSLQQQARFDAFIAEFNTERPHEALDMATPASRYTSSPRPFTGLPDLAYPLHDREAIVGNSGQIRLNKANVAISHVLAGQKIGLRETDDGIWLVSFMQYDLGYIDLDKCRLQTINNPFSTKV
jgi:transposase InsO family protein